MNGKQLKNSILQWAIQGKLVPQDPNDEPASVLLERIREEKARLVKEGKIKKDKNESIIFRGDDNSHYEKFLATGEVKCIDDEIPFEIPEGWEWVRINTIAVSQLGKTLDRGKDIGQEYPYLCSINVYYDGIDLSKVKRFKLREDELSRYRLQKGDLLICEGGDYGRCCVWNREEEMYYQNALHRVRFYCGLLPDFFKYVFELYRKIGYIVGQGQTIKHFTYESMKSIVFPLPTIGDQRRIVSKIDELIPLINRYNSSQHELDELNSGVQTRLRKSILQEAIQGKLVPQDPNDEPASVLLERIREEKQRLLKEGKLKKKDLVDSIIFKGEDNKYFEKIGKEIICIDDDIPFDIPISWEWVRLGNLFQHNTGKALNGSNQKGTLYEYITTSNLYWNQFVLDKLRQMPFTDEELEKCTVRKGDLLICEGGDIGRCAIWNYDYNIRIQNHIHRLRAFTPVCTSFFYYTMYLYKHIGLIGGKGIGIQGLSSNALHKLLLPLPPMNEQQRIVNKIELAIASIMSR